MKLPKDIGSKNLAILEDMKKQTPLVFISGEAII